MSRSTRRLVLLPRTPMFRTMSGKRSRGGEVAVTMRRHARKDCWSLPRVTVMLAGIAVLPPQSGSVSLWSSGAEHAIAPTNYGNFSSPIGSPDATLWSAFGWSALGPMPQAQGSDPAVTALLYGTVS